MKATVTMPEPAFDLTPGDQIEVVGFVWQGYFLAAVWRDDAGQINTIPAWAIRMEPRTLEQAAA